VSTWPTMLVECRKVALGPAGSPGDTGLDLTIEPGDICTIVGSRGSGKTRLCQLVCGIEQPRRGTITVDGNDVAGRPGETRHRVTGVVPEAPLWPNWSPLSNIAFVLRLCGLQPVSEEDAVQALRLSEVPDRLFRAPAKGLSQFHRFGVWLAIHRLRGVRVLVLDEPFLHLTGSEIEDLSRLIQEAVQPGSEGCALITTSSADVPAGVARQRYRITRGRLMPIETPTSWIDGDSDLLLVQPSNQAT
jgi:ABC-type multidrug transport system ATPase subunit